MKNVALVTSEKYALVVYCLMKGVEMNLDNNVVLYVVDLLGLIMFMIYTIKVSKVEIYENLELYKDVEYWSKEKGMWYIRWGAYKMCLYVIFPLIIFLDVYHIIVFFL